MVYNHVVEDPSDHAEIGLRGLDLNFSTKIRRGLLEMAPVSFDIC